MKTFPFVPRQLHVLLNVYVIKKKPKCWIFYKAIKLWIFINNWYFYLEYIIFPFIFILLLLVAGTAASFGPNCFKPCPQQSMVQAALKLALVPIVNLEAVKHHMINYI